MSTTSAVTTASELNNEQRLHLYREMLCIRSFEESVRDLFERRVIPGIAHLYIGQEAVPVGVCASLNADDYITSTHRGHGHCLAKGADYGRMFAELIGKVDGYCRGKGGSMHIANQDRGNLGANGIVGGSVGLATGSALSSKLRKSGQVTVCFFGDGALNQGILLEAMNMAALWSLPIIYACENNHYGEYTPTTEVTAGDVERRGEPFGIPSESVDGMDVLAVYDAAAVAIGRARQGEGPSFLVFDTYRYFGHGMNDVTRPYRSREEEDEWRKRDPVDRLARQLVEQECASPGELDTVQDEIKRQMAEAVDFAQNSPFPDVEEVTKHVYAD